MTASLCTSLVCCRNLRRRLSIKPVEVDPTLDLDQALGGVAMAPPPRAASGACGGAAGAENAFAF